MSYFAPNCNSNLNFMLDAVYDLDHVKWKRKNDGHYHFTYSQLHQDIHPWLR
jgi:hypothetical protein